MDRLLNNRVGKAPKSKKRGCLFLIVGSLLALLATGGFVLGVSLLTGLVIEGRHGGEVAYALMTIAKPCYGVALMLFYAILAVWYIAPTKAEVAEQNRRVSLKPGEQPAKALSRRALWLITGGLFLGVLLTAAVCVNTYRLVTPEGVRTYCFFETSSHDWDEATAYTVDCDEDGGLSMTFTMQDGKQYEILLGINSATSEFKDTYTSVTHHATVIDDIMQELGVPRNAKHYERTVKFYKVDYPDLWPYVAEIIGYEELEELPDETVSETESVSDTADETKSD